MSKQNQNVNTGNLKQVLSSIAKQLNLPITQLQQYALDAPYAVARPDGNPWPSGTGSESEKRILYAIAKGLNPMLSLDLGTRWGAFALQIVTGDNDADKPKGRVITVDNEMYIHGTKQPVGKFIPNKFKVEFATYDALEYLQSTVLFYDLIVEDTEHTFAMTKAIYEVAYDKLVPGGVIISHDACHPKFKGAVVEGIKAVGMNPQVYLVDGDSCGFAIWKKYDDNGEPEIEVAREIVDTYVKVYSDDSDEKPVATFDFRETFDDTKLQPIPLPPKPKRKRGKRRKKQVEPEAL